MIYPVEDGFVISSHGSWLAGVYESERAARFAFKCSDEELQRLQDMANERGEGVITWDDIKELRVKK